MNSPIEQREGISQSLISTQESLNLVTFSRIFEPCGYWCFGQLPHVCLCNGVLGFQIGAWMRWLCFHVPCPCIKLCLFQWISYNFWLDRSFWKHRECLSVSDGWTRILILLVFYFFVHVDFNKCVGGMTSNHCCRYQGEHDESG